MINCKKGGSGPSPYLLHWFPRSSSEWRRVAAFAKRFAIVVTDLRDYGDSGKLADGESNDGCSKRTRVRYEVQSDAAAIIESRKERDSPHSRRATDEQT
jgi:pimeloyl-ACP methyl ester carboxylesterase